MNATRWKSLTQFAAYLGREGICRVEETEKGIFVSWIDNSPETLRKREAIMKKERQDKGDEEREQRQIREQVERAHQSAEKAKQADEQVDPEATNLHRKEGESLKLNIGLGSKRAGESKHGKSEDLTSDVSSQSAPAAPPKISMSLGDKKPKNVFASTVKKNPLAGKKGSVTEAPKKMSEQERIMKAEMEAMKRKRAPMDSTLSAKRPKVS